ncbi:hypothetical protein HDV05_008523, partial [Chytridiales sp. JEL 0842]
TYLAKYKVKLVRLADFPDPSTGVSNVGFGTGIDHPVAFAEDGRALATNVGLNPDVTFSSADMYHYPGRIVNATMAKPILLFKAVEPDFPTDTVAAAQITQNIPGVGDFHQLSFYLPFASWFSTSTHLGRVWLNWISNRKYPYVVTPLNEFEVHQKALVVAAVWGDSDSVTDILQGYGTPYDVFIVGSGDLKLEVTADAVGAYSFIVLTGPLKGMPSHLQNEIKEYLIKYNARLVVLNDKPDPASGVDTANGAGTADDQRIYFAPNGTNLAVAAGIQTSVALSTAGLFHVPCKITNSAVAKAIMLFEPNEVYTEPTVAAALITFPGYQQLSFYLPFGAWSQTSMMLGHAWFAWASRRFYVGFRRIMFSSHVDDIFLVTKTTAGQPDYRLSDVDLALVHRWQDSVNRRMPPGSSFKLELALNGNGVYYETWKKTDRSAHRPLMFDMSVYENVDKNIKKPRGGGVNVWAGVPLMIFEDANIARNLDSFRANDSLFNYIYTNKSDFFLSSHTFTHEDLTLASYQDTYGEITVNQNFVRATQLDDKDVWSSRTIVSPAITGIFNGDALQALTDANITSMMGDTSRPNIVNSTNPRWPYITSLESSNFEGFTIIPRSATSIYYNCSTPTENERIYAGLYPSAPLPFSEIISAETTRVIFKLITLRWDPYMFHQANLRSADLTPSILPPIGPTTSLSDYNTDK